MKKQFAYFLLLSLVVALLVVAFAPDAAAIRAKLLCATEEGNCVESWNGADIRIYSDTGSTQTFGVEGTTGAATFASSVTLSNGDLIVADDVRITAQTFITVTDATTFTATGTYQEIRAAGEVTPTLAAGTDGDLLILVNGSNQTINLADSGTLATSGDTALGQYDTLTLMYSATASAWVELAQANN